MKNKHIQKRKTLPVEEGNDFFEAVFGTLGFRVNKERFGVL
jgi:hypothetical protein